MSIFKKLNIVGLFLLINLGLFGQNNPIFIGDKKPQEKIVYATVVGDKKPQEKIVYATVVDSTKAEEEKIKNLIKLANLDTERREKEFKNLGGQIIPVPEAVTVNVGDKKEADFRKTVIFDFAIQNKNPLNLFRSHLNAGPYNAGYLFKGVIPSIGSSNIGSSNDFNSLFNPNNLDSLNKVIYQRNEYLNDFYFRLEEMTFHKMIENDSYYLTCNNLYSVMLPTNEKLFIVLTHDIPTGSNLMEIVNSGINFDTNSVGIFFSYSNNSSNISKKNPEIAIYNFNNTLTEAEKDYRIQALVLSIAQRMYQKEKYHEFCQLLGLDDIKTMNPLLKAIVTNEKMLYEEILSYLESLSYGDDLALKRLFQGKNSYKILEEFIFKNVPSVFKLYILAKLEVSSKG